MYRKTFLSNRGVIKKALFPNGLLVIMTIAIAGCADEGTQTRNMAAFAPQAADSATQAACHICLDQRDPYVDAKLNTQMTFSSAVGIDLVGRLMDASANAVSKSINDSSNKQIQDKANRLSAPLEGHGVGDWFRDALQVQIASAVRSSTWLRAMPQPIGAGAANIREAEILHRIGGESNIVLPGVDGEHPAIAIGTSYKLSYDAAYLIMQTDVVYYRAGQKTASYGRSYYYFSEPVGAEKEEAAVAKWTASGQQLLRRRLSEGTAETVAMLKGDFLAPTPRDPADHLADVTYFDAVSLVDVQKRGQVIPRANRRIIVQLAPFGDWLSVVPEKVQ